MELLKRRKFSDIFNDTFTLLMEDGKHFFKNYFILNGLPLLFFLILVYFLSTTFYGLGTYQQGDSAEIFMEYTKENSGLFIFLGILSFIFMIIFAIIQYSFVPIYLMLYQKNNGANFTAKEIFDVMFKQKLGRIIIFILASILVGILIAIPLIIIMFISIFTIVGFFFVIAFVAIWFNNALMEYLNSDKGVFACFSYGYQLILVRFWDYVGAIGLFILMTSFISGGLSLVTSILTMTLSANAANQEERSLFLTLAMIFSFVISKMVSIFVQTVVQLAQGIVYYSAKEETENIATKSEIDKIGLGE
jgi:hypothetical protein